MSVRCMKIVGTRGHPFVGLPRMHDFVTAPDEPVDVNELITSPNVSLYCLEDEAREAVFVELPDEFDLTRLPFLFETQFRHARRVFTLPYETFTELSGRLAPIHRLIMVYMTGRCGSTLLSHALNQLDSVASLSEPAAPGQFAYLKSAYRGREKELSALLEATIRFVFKTVSAKQPVAYALKPPIETLQAIDLFEGIFPHAKNLFLYRDTVGWVSSVFRHWNAAWFPPKVRLEWLLAQQRVMCNVDPRPLLPYLGEGATSFSPVQGLTLVWLGLMQEYLNVHARGTPMLAVRYADLRAHPRQVLEEIVRYCDLMPCWRDDVLKVLARDSQEGSFLHRKNPGEGNKVRFTPEQLAQITSVIQRHPVLNRSDIVVPGSLAVAT